MEDYSLALKRVAKFPRPFPENHGNEEKAGLQPEGGTFRNGEYGWLSAGSYLEIVDMNSGFKVARFDFASQFANVYVHISTIVELPDFTTPVLAIGFRTDSDESGFVCLYSVHGSRPLQILQFPDNVSVLHPLANHFDEQEDILYRDFDGCLIVGFDSGKTALIDLDMRELQQRLSLQSKPQSSQSNEPVPVPCVTIPSDATEEEIRKCHKEAHRQKCGFGLDLKVLEDAGPVLSLLPLPQMSTLAVGLCDGRLVLYHLDGNMDAFHLALPPEPMSPLVGMAFMEPADDPKACAYLWAFHETPEMAIAVMHSLVFESRRSVGNNASPSSSSVSSLTSTRDAYVYQKFQSCRVRLTMPIQERGSVPISCQAICQPLGSVEESLTCVCLLAWRTERKTSMLMVFDLNQWYKEQMPWVGNWRDMPRYVAIYPLNEDPLAVRLDARSLSWFNSLDRPEEHFYPTAMGFDCLLLTYKGSSRYHWPGLQSRALNMLEYCGPNAILEPDMCYRAMLNATLIPQFSEESFKLDTTLAKKRELLLSIALEYNCVGLLKRCARVWADGSHMGRDPSRGLSLATLTDWIWSRSRTIKQYCNAMCVPLFDFSGQQLGTAEQKRMSHCAVQLKWLAEIMDMIMTTCSQYIPDEILDQLKEQQESIQIASEYQEVLVWMFNMGLLPESNGSNLNTSLDSSLTSGLARDERQKISMVYPFELLNNFYQQKREQIFEGDRKYMQNTPTWNSCSMLYIDALIDKECGGVALYRDWREDGGTGLYPPRSLQSMLRVLLLPNVSIQSKYSLFMYLFMDLNVVYQDHECRSLVQSLYKFPAAFKMPKDMIKLIESFWHLDHNNFEVAVADLKASTMSKWQLELMVECLFIHRCAHLSLRALQMPGPSISPVIEMRVLLGNNLISEAFLFQKKHGDKTLLLEFFNSCYTMGSLRSILRLPLTETEGQLLGEFLLSVDASMPRNLHFVYLLQRSKYVEAVDLVEQLRLKRSSQQMIDTGSVAAVLTTYKSTMPPIYQEMSDIYKRNGGTGLKSTNSLLSAPGTPQSTMEQSQNTRLAMATPLSSQLIRNKVDVNSSVFQMAITAVKEATNYSLFQGQQTRSPLNKFTSIPFLRKPLQENMYEPDASTVIYPKIVDGQAEKNKRALEDRERDDSFAKRRKLDDINTSLLTPFQPMKSDELQAFSGRKKIVPEASVLTTPIVKRVLSATGHLSPVGGSSRKMTPQSILKARNIFRESPGPEEKILRFRGASSVSPSIFDVSAIKKPDDGRMPRAFDGPKPRRSIRSLTPEENIMSSTRNQIEVDGGEGRRVSVGEKSKRFADLEKEMMSKMSAVAEEEKVKEDEKLLKKQREAEEEEKIRNKRIEEESVRMTRSKAHALEESPLKNILPRRELRSKSKETEPQPGTSGEGAEETSRKFLAISPRRSLRSRTPEQLSPKRRITTTTTTTSVTKSTTKKTLTRMVLESNAKRNLLERPEMIPREDDEVEKMDETLDSTLPMSEYSLNSGLDPLAGERTILTDNSCISDSMLGEWRERLRGEKEVTKDSFVSDTSEIHSVADALVDTPNQSFQFVAAEVNTSVEEEIEEKLTEQNQLGEVTVYHPLERVIEDQTVEKERQEREEEDVPGPSKSPEIEKVKTFKSPDETFKIPSPPKKSNPDSSTLIINQETFIVTPAEEEKADEEKNKDELSSDDGSSLGEDFHDSESDLSNLSNRSEASDNSDKMRNNFPLDDDEEEQEEEEDFSEDFDEDSDRSGFSDDGESEDLDAPKAKPFKTNEVIDLLDSDDEVEGGNAKEEQDDDEDDCQVDVESAGEREVETDEDELERNLDEFAEEEEEVEEQPEEENYIPAQSISRVDYEQTYDVVQPVVVVAGEQQQQENEKSPNKSLESPQFEAIFGRGGEDKSPEIMDEGMDNIYEDMEVDVVGDVEEEGGGLNDALMIDEESKEAEMHLRIDEDSLPESESIVGEGTINTLDKAAVLDDTAVREEEEQGEGVDGEQREEVIEVIPPPKVAYQTTEEEDEGKEKEVDVNVPLQEVATVPVDEDKNNPEENIPAEEENIVPEIVPEESNNENEVVPSNNPDQGNEVVLPEIVETVPDPVLTTEVGEKEMQELDEVKEIPSEQPDTQSDPPEIPEIQIEPPQIQIERPQIANPEEKIAMDEKTLPEDLSPKKIQVPEIVETPAAPVSQSSVEPSSQPDSPAPGPSESESSQPEKLTVRRRSVRAASQPRNSLAASDEPQAGRILTRRATSEALEPNPGTPRKERRNSHLFDQGTEERITPNLRMTPMRLARLNESTENLHSTGTPTRRARGTSVESDAAGSRTPSTRSTRSRAKGNQEHDDEDDNVSVTSNASRRSLRSRKAVAAGDTDADDAKSTVSSSSRKGSTTSGATTTRAKKTLIDTAIPEEPEMSEYSLTRRLTRNQQQMMERSMKVQNRALDTSSSTISPGTPSVVEESAESDADSVTSKISRASQQRRSVRARSKESDISESGGSTRSTRSARMKPPTAAKKKLSSIIEAEGGGGGSIAAEREEEEDPSAAGDSSTPPKKRGRARMQK